MKTARLFTITGSIILFVTGCLHANGYSKVVLAGLAKQSVDPVVAGVLKVGWFTLSGEMMTLAIIAFLAASMERGARIVVVCALASAANGFLLLHFLGPFIGVYITDAVTLLFLLGGSLQAKAGSSAP
jgi:peptidoglycan/LPS O-acetylase OafA/YrhL